MYTQFCYTGGWHGMAPKVSTTEPKPTCKHLSSPDKWGAEAPRSSRLDKQCNFPEAKTHRAGVPLLTWEHGEKGVLMVSSIIPTAFVPIYFSRNYWNDWLPRVGISPSWQNAAACDKLQTAHHTFHLLRNTLLDLCEGKQPCQVLPTLQVTAAPKPKQNCERR